MIDFVEAYESAVTSDLPDWGKVVAFSGLVYLSYHFYNTSQMETFYWVAGFTAYLLIVFLLCIINNVRNCRNYVMPKLMSWQYPAFAMKTLVSVVPLAALLIWCGNKLLSLKLLADFPEIEMVLPWVVWIILGSIVIMATLSFAKTGNPLSVLDVKTIFKYSIDILPHLLLILFVLLVFNTIIVGLTAYLFSIFLSLQHPIFIAICSLVLVLDVVALGSCLAQLEYQVVPSDEDEHVI